MDNPTNDKMLEELVIKESIVSATGLTSENLQIGIRGDPSLRETALYRNKYSSCVDHVIGQLASHLEELLLNRSTYRLYIGFNNGEVRTASVFDPMREETHDAEKLADHQYIERHFPVISYQDKISAVQMIYETMEKNGIYERLPEYWKRIMIRRNQNWNPMSEQDIHRIMPTLKMLRSIEEYYLRNVTVCTIQDLIRFQFNCDGTQIIKSKNYEKFLTDNFNQ